MEQGTVYVVHFSPAGTTRRVAEIIAAAAGARGRKVHLVDLAGPDGGPGAPALQAGDVLFVGSPTYAHHAVPRVAEFIRGLPEAAGAFCAPFVTYGAVTSGVVLFQMARELEKKGLGILGGIKVVAAHSLLWHAEAPLGAGHPDAGDEEGIRAFVRAVLEKTEGPDASTLPSEALDYQDEKIKEAASESSLAVLRSLFPLPAVNAEACTQCGICETSCPVANISLDPYPTLGDRCVLCFNCIRLCPEGAVTSPVLPMLEGEILKRRDQFNETPETRYFV